PHPARELDARLSLLLGYSPMQEKMASRNPVVRALASGASYVWFTVSLALARTLPRRVMYALAHHTIGAYMRRRSKYLAAGGSTLAIILGGAPDSDTVRRKSLELIDAHFAAWEDFLHFATRPPQESASLVAGVQGFEHIVEGRRRGKGVL